MPRTSIIVALLASAAFATGCAGSGATPSAAPTAAAPAAQTSAPTPGPTEAQAPTPAVPSGPTDPAIEAFLSRVAEPGLSYQLAQTGAFSGAGQTFQADYALRVAGEDVAGVIEVVDPATQQGQRIEFVSVGEMTYLNLGDGWSDGPRDDALVADVLDWPRFLGDPGKLVRVEGEADADPDLLHFRASEPIPYQTSSMRDLGVVGSITALDVWLTADGVPDHLVFHSTADASAASGEIETVEADSTITLSEWGEPMTIEAPE